MISTRDIKRKIRTVQNIEQICRAMKTVASIRLQRMEQWLDRSRPYRQGLAGMVKRVAAVTEEHPFLQAREVKRTGLVVVTSDRGLCGGYNANTMRRALAKGDPEGTAVIALGCRGEERFMRRGYKILDRIVPLGGEPEASAVWGGADRVGERYRAGELDRVVLVYTGFLGGMRSEVRTEVLLPVTPEEMAETDTIFEPASGELLSGLMRRYLRTELLGAVLQASTSEHAARVAAMTAATDNAGDMIRSLTLAYNKARQESITRELTEIVSAAEATA